MDGFNMMHMQNNNTNPGGGSGGGGGGGGGENNAGKKAVHVKVILGHIHSHHTMTMT
jgi:hypothetical protein